MPAVRSYSSRPLGCMLMGAMTTKRESEKKEEGSM